MTRSLKKSKLIIETPPGHDPEWDWILGVVLGDWLGLTWVRLIKKDLREVRLRLDKEQGMLTMPATYFLGANEGSIDRSHLAHEPLREWCPELPQDRKALSEDTIPVLFGEPGTTKGRSIDYLPIDVFGSIYFMLARIEEIVSPDRDHLDRFSSPQALASRAGFAHRPIVDEYVELLRTRFGLIWLGLRLRQSDFRMLVSHDVDAPNSFGFGSPYFYMRGLYKQLLREKRVNLLKYAFRSLLRTPSAPAEADPLNTFDWLMDQSESQGIKSAFYFFGAHTKIRQDAAYAPSHPGIRNLLRRIHARGHEIGLHPSFNTYLDPDRLASEANALRQVCMEEGIEQKTWGGRMHFLRAQWPETARAWEAADMAYDSTMGFADLAGFRCGTCHEYWAFDPIRRLAMSLRLRPLIAMECSIIAAQYMGLGYSDEAFTQFVRLKDLCRRYGGDFTLLWHNSHFNRPEDFDFYKAVLAH